MRTRSSHSTSVTLTIAATLALMTSALTPGNLNAAGAVPDVSGQWTWNESVIVVAPGFAVAEIFDVDIEGPVMQVRCQTWGGLTIQQAGTSFTGSADQQWACVTAGGQVAQDAPFPADFDISGSITGRAVQFTADVGQGVSCSYQGSLTVAGDVATALKATGGCDVPLPFHPNMDKSVSFDATRQ